MIKDESGEKIPMRPGASPIKKLFPVLCGALEMWLLAGTLMLCSAAVGRAAVSLTGAGATFPYPMYSKWFDTYHKLHPDLEINYQSIGSGGGIRQITAGTVDFGASDGPMTDEQIAAFKEKQGTNILHFPTVLGADVSAYNIRCSSGVAVYSRGAGRYFSRRY